MQIYIFHLVFWSIRPDNFYSYTRFHPLSVPVRHAFPHRHKTSEGGHRRCGASLAIRTDP